METSADDRRNAFGTWMRTGRWPGVGRLVEVKFNPNHDERGRFTTGSGGWMGGGFTGGGGGGTGGGGASGSWSDPVRKPASPNGARSGSGTTVVVARARPVAKGGGALRTEKRGTYTYRIDSENRPKLITGQLTLAEKPYQRSRTAQANAGGSDRRSGDEGGHYVAARFNGPTDAFNHFAQDRNFNRSDYAKLENKLSANKKAGKSVSITIIPRFEGNSKRPTSLIFNYVVNGYSRSKVFENSPNGGR